MYRSSIWKEANLIRDNMELRTGGGNYKKDYRRYCNILRGRIRTDNVGWDDIVGVTTLSIVGTAAEDNELLKQQALELASISTDLYVMLCERKVDHSGIREEGEEIKSEHSTLVLIDTNTETEL